MNGRSILRAISALGLTGAVFLTSGAAVAETPGPLDRAIIHGLIHNGRIVEQNLLFLRAEEIDTGFSFQRCFLFRDAAGRTLYLLPSDLEEGELRRGAFYRFSLRFLNYSPGGRPIARLAETERERRLADLEAMQDGDADGNGGIRPYEGDITEDDPRVDEVRANIVEGQAPPQSLKLRYGGARGNYVSFYDIEGRVIYYRYREDRFDRRAERKIRGLVEGQAYRVEGGLRGLLADEKFIARTDAVFPQLLPDEDSILVFEFEGAYPLRIDQILF